MVTVLEYLWVKYPETIAALRVGKLITVEAVINHRARFFPSSSQAEIKVGMRHDAYRRIHGRLRQVSWE